MSKSNLPIELMIIPFNFPVWSLFSVSKEKSFGAIVGPWEKANLQIITIEGKRLKSDRFPINSDFRQVSSN
jgi:hypothetical protein